MPKRSSFRDIREKVPKLCSWNLLQAKSVMARLDSQRWHSRYACRYLVHIEGRAVLVLLALVAVISALASGMNKRFHIPDPNALENAFFTTCKFREKYHAKCTEWVWMHLWSFTQLPSEIVFKINYEVKKTRITFFIDVPNVMCDWEITHFKF